MSLIAIGNGVPSHGTFCFGVTQLYNCIPNFDVNVDNKSRHHLINFMKKTLTEKKYMLTYYSDWRSIKIHYGHTPRNLLMSNDLLLFLMIGYTHFL